MPKSSEARLRANAKYNSRFDQVRIRVPAGELEEIKAYAKSNGESLAEYIRRLIKQDMKKESI